MNKSYYSVIEAEWTIWCIISQAMKKPNFAKKKPKVIEYKFLSAKYWKASLLYILEDIKRNIYIWLKNKTRYMLWFWGFFVLGYCCYYLPTLKSSVVSRMWDFLLKELIRRKSSFLSIIYKSAAQKSSEIRFTLVQEDVVW